MVLNLLYLTGEEILTFDQRRMMNEEVIMKVITSNYKHYEILQNAREHY